MARREPSLSECVRQAVDASGFSRYAICKATGIDPAQMSRFMAGAGGFGLEALDRLAAFLGLRVTAPNHSKRSKRR